MKITKTEKKKHSKQGIKSRNKTKRFHGKRIKSRNKTKRFHGKRIKSHTRKHRGGAFWRRSPKKKNQGEDTCEDLLKKIIKNILRKENNKMFQIIHQLEVDDQIIHSKNDDDKFDVIEKMIDFVRNKNWVKFPAFCGLALASLKNIEKNIRDESRTESALTLLFEEIRNYLNSVNQAAEKTLKITLGIDINKLKEQLMDTDIIIVSQEKIKRASPFDIYDCLSKEDQTRLIEIFKRDPKKYYSLFLPFNGRSIRDIEQILPFNGNGTDSARKNWDEWLDDEAIMEENEKGTMDAPQQGQSGQQQQQQPSGRAEEDAAEEQPAGQTPPAITTAAAAAEEDTETETGKETETETETEKETETGAVKAKAAEEEEDEEEEITTFTPTYSGAVFAFGIIGGLGLVTILANINE